jgi:hypothetical protein
MILNVSPNLKWRRTLHELLILLENEFLKTCASIYLAYGIRIRKTIQVIILKVFCNGHGRHNLVAEAHISFHPRLLYLCLKIYTHFNKYIP